MKIIKIDKKAKKDLDIIFEIIYADKPNAAKTYLKKILSYIQLLKQSPEMGKRCQESGFKRECRVLYYKNYTILYKVYKTHISIKRIINTKQNYKGK